MWLSDTNSINHLETDINELINLSDISSTERSNLILARIGQGKFRTDLIKIWKCCTISNYTDVSILIASHIKPWCRSENEERLDPYNGLLLLPNYDKIFDKGYISFDDNGKILISPLLIDLELLNIHSELM